MKSVLAALRIVVTVVLYRVRKLEMANLLAAISIAVALRLPWAEVAQRATFALVLNALVYLNNDYIDVAIDLKSSDKDHDNARFLANNLRAALWAQLIMAAALVGAALLIDPGLSLVIVVGGGVCWWYSARLKRVPYLDVLAMMIWGCAMPLLGAPVEQALGWALAIQLGLFSGVFESIQVIRDADDDARQGLRTTGVALGKPRTLKLARALMVASTLYLFLVVHPAAGLISLGALLMPFDTGAIARYWTRIKVVYGVAWLIACATVFLLGRSGGLFWQVPHSDASREERSTALANVLIAHD